MKKEKKEMNLKKDIFATDSMHLFTMLCGYFLLLLVLYSIFQMIRLINLNIINIVSIIIPIIVYLLKCKEKSTKTKIIIISLFSFIILGLPFFFCKTYDITEDGNAYHKPSIALIKEGWNPFHETIEEFRKKSDIVIASEKELNNNIWMEHYPKSTWIIGAAIYSYTNNIECGKSLAVILDIMLMIITYNCLAKVLDKKWANIISILIAMNPIFIVQAFTFYVDGIMGILFGIEVLLLMEWKPNEKYNKSLWICLASVAAIMVNVKFTGLLCSGVVAATYYFYQLIKERKNKNYFNFFKKATIPFVIIYITAVFLVGANSYVRNTLDHKNPLYPLFGSDKIDIVTTQQPKSFKNKTKTEKFLISLFSKSENATYEKDPNLKIPLSVYKDELESTTLPDTRIGGFGPLFSMIMIVSIISLCLGFYRLYKYNRDKIIYFVLPILSIIVSIILVGEAWWARYIPQLYFLPILSIVLILFDNEKNKSKNISLVPAIVLAIFICLNACIFSYGIYNKLRESRAISRDINEMKQMNNLKLCTINKAMYGYYYTLDDNHVKYQIENELDATNGVDKYWSRIWINNKESDA